MVIPFSLCVEEKLCRVCQAGILLQFHVLRPQRDVSDVIPPTRRRIGSVFERKRPARGIKGSRFNDEFEAWRSRPRCAGRRLSNRFCRPLACDGVYLAGVLVSELSLEAVQPDLTTLTSFSVLNVATQLWTKVAEHL